MIYLGKIYEIGKEYISEETIQIEIEKILHFLKEEKRTYSMNIFLLKETIDYLENRVREEANTKIFQ